MDGDRFEPFDGSAPATRRLARALTGPERPADFVAFDLEPKEWQKPILRELKEARALERNRNLVVAATGTGKTLIAAFDYAGLQREGRVDSLLFVAHRREILEQSRRVFRQALQRPDESLTARALTDETPREERDRAKGDLTSGKVQVLCVVDLFNEGIDIPDVNTLFLFRPTESATVFLQQLGRGPPARALGHSPRELREFLERGYGPRSLAAGPSSFSTRSPVPGTFRTRPAPEFVRSAGLEAHDADCRTGTFLDGGSGVPGQRSGARAAVREEHRCRRGGSDGFASACHARKAGAGLRGSSPDARQDGRARG